MAATERIDMQVRVAGDKATQPDEFVTRSQLVAGTNITFTNQADGDIEISATSGGGTPTGTPNAYAYYDSSGNLSSSTRLTQTSGNIQNNIPVEGSNNSNLVNLQIDASSTGTFFGLGTNAVVIKHNALIYNTVPFIYTNNDVSAINGSDGYDNTFTAGISTRGHYVMNTSLTNQLRSTLNSNITIVHERYVFAAIPESLAQFNSASRDRYYGQGLVPIGVESDSISVLGNTTIPASTTTTFFTIPIAQYTNLQTELNSQVFTNSGIMVELEILLYSSNTPSVDFSCNTAIVDGYIESYLLQNSSNNTGWNTSQYFDSTPSVAFATNTSANSTVSISSVNTNGYLLIRTKFIITSLTSDITFALTTGAGNSLDIKQFKSKWTIRESLANRMRN